MTADITEPDEYVRHTKADPAASAAIKAAKDEVDR